VPSPVVILNPVAGRGARSWPLYEAELKRRGVSICATQKAGDAREFAREAIEAGADVLIAAGGDGTLGEVAGAILESGQRRVRLGVLPIGTGNDFARTLGVWGEPKRALNAIFEGTTRRFDAGRIECNGRERVWLNVAGCGFDALVAKRINDWGQRKTMRRARGLAAYLLATARELAEFRAFDAQLELDGERLEIPAVLVAVANAKSYGGGMLVCPDAKLDDGLFDVCIIQKVSRSEFLRAFPGVFAGKHTNHPKVLMRRCRAIRVESKQSVPVLADGEIEGSAPFACEIVPDALEVCAPHEWG
jgi:diacylglycerol kinase (ATP)